MRRKDTEDLRPFFGFYIKAGHVGIAFARSAERNAALMIALCIPERDPRAFSGDQALESLRTSRASSGAFGGFLGR